MKNDCDYGWPFVGNCIEDRASHDSEKIEVAIPRFDGDTGGITMWFHVACAENVNASKNPTSATVIYSLGVWSEI